MKTTKCILTCIALLTGLGLTAAEQPKHTRVGIYDSRAVAYAWFWTPEHQRDQNELMANAKAAKEAGKTEEFKALERKLKGAQAKIHEQVFSTAPPDEALAALKDRVPQIQQEAGVSQLISKWNKEALNPYKKDQQIDITDVLVREFKPGEKQLKLIKDMQSKPPIPLENLRKMKDK